VEQVGVVVAVPDPEHRHSKSDRQPAAVAIPQRIDESPAGGLLVEGVVVDDIERQLALPHLLCDLQAFPASIAGLALVVAEGPKRQHGGTAGQLGILREDLLHAADEYVEVHLSAGRLELQPALDRRADVKG
jgi:hypothetical protein